MLVVVEIFFTKIESWYDENRLRKKTTSLWDSAFDHHKIL